MYSHFRQLSRTGIWVNLSRKLRDAEQQHSGKESHPSAAMLDSQSIKTGDESAHICGFDAHKHIKGRKWHLLVDTLGLPLVTPANRHDRQGTRRRLAGLNYFVLHLKTIWADAACRGKELAGWCKVQGSWDRDIGERILGVRGFSIQPKQWVVERTFGWLSRNRPISKDDERKGQTSETLIEGAMTHLL